MNAITKSFYTGIIQPNTPLPEIATRVTIQVEVTNGSGQAWLSTGDNPVCLSYHWLDEDRKIIVHDGIRSPLPQHGIAAETTAKVSVTVAPPPFTGKLHLVFTLVHEGVHWFDEFQEFQPSIHAVEILEFLPPVGGPEGMTVDERVRMTTSCHDSDQIPKVPNAGQIIEMEGMSLQIMHEGSRVVAGGYYGEWMTELIKKLKGHHEPQEELLFHHLLKRIAPSSLMVELGAFWSYYSTWFLGAIHGSQAICVEPDAGNLNCGKMNLALNGRMGLFYQACIGENFLEECPFRQETNGDIVHIPQFDLPKILELTEGRKIELLHIDTQGAELPFLRSFSHADWQQRIRFMVISTHHASISGSATTHRDCLVALIGLGASILAEHSVEESFSGDGLILASFDSTDGQTPFPPISRNNPRNSFYGDAPIRPPQVHTGQIAKPCSLLQPGLLARVKGVKTDFGPMLTMEMDQCIGRALRQSGTFEEKKIKEVVHFLKQHHGFKPECFVDIGANIGTHLIYSLNNELFKFAVGIEADSLNYTLLSRNVELNGLVNRVQLFNMALSNRSGSVTMELSKTNFGDHRVRTRHQATATLLEEDNRLTYSTISDSLDDLFAERQIELSSNTLVWIDTQGHEGQVLTGAQNTFTQEKPFVVIEFWPYGVERSSGKQLLLNFLKQCRSIYDINSDRWQERPAVSPDWIETHYETMLAATNKGDYPFTDLLIVF